jgi:RIO kinase 1
VRGELNVDAPLTGKFIHETGPVNLESVMDEIEDARFEEEARRMRMAEE